MNLNNGINTTQELFCHGIPASSLVLNSKILITLMVLHTYISITATIGNLLVLVTIWRSPNLHSPSNTLLFGLALSDLSVGVVSEPLHIGFQADLFSKTGKITSCTLTKVRNLICLSNSSNHFNCNSNECWSLSSDISAPEIWTSGHRKENKKSHFMPLVDK